MTTSMHLLGQDMPTLGNIRTVTPELAKDCVVQIHVESTQCITLATSTTIIPVDPCTTGDVPRITLSTPPAHLSNHMESRTTLTLE